MRVLAAFALAALVALAVGPAASEATPDMLVGCAAPRDLRAVGPALHRVAARIESGEPLTIVALGSSSTQGVGASGPASSYPSRLEAELRTRLPDLAIRVLNRGKGGEEAPQMLARLQQDVIAEKPDLVVWQVGTNAVLRHDDVRFEEAVIEQGLARLKATGADIVLMDMQYAPRVVARVSYPAMERLIASAAKREGVGLFRRFAIMQYWLSAQPQGAPTVGSDGLHMNDRGYACLGAELAEAVAENWRVQHLARASAASQLAHLNQPPKNAGGPTAAAP